ncbi:MAG TPA: CvpA family protein [Candidatus Limnocylindrales bacterium]|jgi:hypothetical protein|nr:CvpA family protein [Candidatus Limnocylindrales bacterium]
MTIWLLVVLVLASLAGLGFRQGAIRVGFSFFGIVVGALLAVPLGRLLGKLLGIVGLKDPLLVWALGPILAFVVISVAFKVAAAAVHHKVDVHYKYHAGDLRLALWERLNHRLGLCLGLLNGTAYLALIAFALYCSSYVTVQVASSDSDPKWMRLLNTLGRDLHNTGFVKVARALDSIPQVDYDMADFGALLYRNPLAQARLRSYPALLPLAELTEFQALGNDKDFTEAWQRQDPIMNLLALPTVQGIRKNPELLKSIWQTVEPDLADLRTYLQTYHSAKYDPIKILGRWRFDVPAAISAYRRAKPNMSSSQMQRVRSDMEAAFGKANLVAMPNKQLTLKDAPSLKIVPGAAAAGGAQTIQGQWQDANAGKYALNLGGADLAATVEGDRLSFKSDTTAWVFSRED